MLLYSLGNTYNNKNKLYPYLSIVPIHKSSVLRGIARRFSAKYVLLDISQGLQENACVGISFLVKLHAGGLKLYLKKESEAEVFL